MTPQQAHGWQLSPGLWVVIAASIGLPIAAAFVISVSSPRRACPSGDCCAGTSDVQTVERTKAADTANDIGDRAPQGDVDPHAGHDR